MALIVPCLLFMIVCFILGGEKYWLNTVVANLGQERSMPHAIYVILRATIVSPFIWLFWVYIFQILFNAKWSQKLTIPHGIRTNYILFSYISVIAFLGAAYATALIGTNKNQFIESFISAASLSSVSIVIVKNLDDRRIRTKALTVALVLMASMILFPAAQLLFFNKIGCITLASEKEYKEKKLIAEFINTLPKPLYFPFFPFDLPWYATNNKYPIVKFDEVAHHRFKKLYGGGIRGLVASRQFNSIIVDRKNWECHRAAVEAGYKAKPLPDVFDSHIPKEFRSYLFILENK